MPCLPTPKIKPPAAAPAPPAEGATDLRVGAPEEGTNRSRGAVGRLALRVGRGNPQQ